MMNPKLQVLTIIIALLTLGWAIFSHVQKNELEYQAELDAKKIILLTKQIIDNDKQISIHVKNILVLKEELRWETDSRNHFRHLSQHYKTQADQMQLEIDQLKTSLHEKPHTLELSDDNHWLFFRKWSKP